MPTSPHLRRDSLRPRLPSDTATTTLLQALNLLILSLAALKNAGETSFEASTPARAAAIQRIVLFIRDAWTEETFMAELAKADERLPQRGVVDAAEMFVGMWISSAVATLRDGGCESDAEDLVKAVEGLGGGRAEGTGDGRVAQRERRGVEAVMWKEQELWYERL